MHAKRSADREARCAFARPSALAMTIASRGLVSHSGLIRTRTAFDSVPSPAEIQSRAQPSWRFLVGSVAVIRWVDSFQREAPLALSSRRAFGAPAFFRSSA